MRISARVRTLLARRDGTTSVAVIGASNNRRKYGNIITRDLLGKGFAVFPVNPKESSICGVPASPRLDQLSRGVDIVDFVVPPDVSLEVLAELRGDRSEVAWFQPGSYDRSVVEAAQRLFPEVIAGDCIMVEAP